MAWIKTTGKLGFNINGTWSKTLGTALQTNPFDVRLNYGPTSTDRPFVFNASYYYNTGKLHTSRRLSTSVGRMDHLRNLNVAVRRLHSRCAWEWRAKLQSGDFLYRSACKCEGPRVSARPRWLLHTLARMLLSRFCLCLTCNPTSGLIHYQRVNGNCFNAPAVGTQGGQNYPYMSAGAYFDNDLAIYRAFRIHETQQIQFRASAFNWLNHPIPGFSGSGGGSPLA